MNRILKKEILWVTVLLMLMALVVIQPANAQTDPTATPEGYPPPATPTQPDDGYPTGRPAANGPAAEEGYIPPTAAPTATNSPTIIGEDTTEETAVSTPTISQSSLVRNRMVLWAGFLVTLFIFGLAVYGAMLMYTRVRK